MDREKYLSIDNYKNLHTGLQDVLYKIDSKLKDFLNINRLQFYLVKQRMEFAKDLTDNITFYVIAYDFFHESDDIRFRETQVIFTIVLTIKEDEDKFNIRAGFESNYKVKSSEKFDNLSILSSDAKLYFDNAPNTFIEITERFFKKEFEFRTIKSL